MDLLFVWIDDFFSIKNQNFNFGFEYKFEFNREKKKIYVKELPYNIPNNFFGKRISHLSAVVGENGSGKTMLFSFISSFLGNYYAKSVFLLRNEKGEHILYFDNSFNDIEIENETNLKIKIKKLPYNDTVTQDLQKEKLQKVFFSNAASSLRNLIHGSTEDISTSAILNKKGMTIEISKFDELLNQINFILKKPKDFELGFENRLKSIDVYFDNFFKKDYYIERYQDFQILGVDEYVYSLQVGKTKPGWVEIRNPFLIPYFICYLVFPQVCEDFQSIENIREELFESLKIPATKKGEDNDFEAPLKAIESFFKHIKKENQYYELIYSLIEEIKENKEKYIVYGKEGQKLERLYIYDFHFTIENSRFEDFHTLIELNLKSLQAKQKLINYSWGLSSGENAYLTIFSRIYNWAYQSGLTNNTKFPAKFKHVWLLIDEGELYMHPRWQKEFVSRIVSFTDFAFQKAKVQIFLSSHSPFIISDIPKRNIVFIERDKEGYTAVSEIEHSETFGANIFNLFTDSFFLDAGLIGNYASEKIDMALSLLSKEQSIENSIGYLDNFSKMIGEPILRSHLQKQLEFYSLDEEQIREKYKKIQKMVKKINQQNKNAPD